MLTEARLAILLDIAFVHGAYHDKKTGLRLVVVENEFVRVKASINGDQFDSLWDIFLFNRLGHPWIAWRGDIEPRTLIFKRVCR